MKGWTTHPNNPTVAEIIDLAERVLNLSGKLDSRASNLVYKTTTVLTIGRTHLRRFPHGRLEIRKPNTSPNKGGIQAWGLVLCSETDEPPSYNPDAIDRLVVQLRRVLILESLANL